MEKPGLGTLSGKAKIAGTVAGIGGAMLFIFYKGVEIHLWSTHVDLLHHDHQHVAPSHRGSASHVLGILLCLASSFSYAMWLILQVTFQFNNNSNFYNSFLIYLFIYSIAIVFEDRQK